MTHKDWELKVAERVWESRCLSIFDSYFLCQDQNEAVEKERTFDGVKGRSTKFVIKFDDETNEVYIEWNTKSDITNFTFPDELLTYVVKRYELENCPDGFQ